MKKIEKPDVPDWSHEDMNCWTEICIAIDTLHDKICALIDNQNELIEKVNFTCNHSMTHCHAEPKKEDPEGYYWCHTERKVCDKLHGLESHGGTDNLFHKVTGPYTDTCPECGDRLIVDYDGDGGYRMICVRWDHMKWTMKLTKAEAIHAWRKVMRK